MKIQEFTSNKVNKRPPPGEYNRVLPPRDRLILLMCAHRQDARQRSTHSQSARARGVGAGPPPPPCSLPLLCATLHCAFGIGQLARHRSPRIGLPRLWRLGRHQPAGGWELPPPPLCSPLMFRCKLALSRIAAHWSPRIGMLHRTTRTAAHRPPPAPPLAPPDRRASGRHRIATRYLCIGSPRIGLSSDRRALDCALDSRVCAGRSRGAKQQCLSPHATPMISSGRMDSCVEFL